MDPNATVTLINGAVEVGDMEAADYAASDLHTWLDRDGFPPNRLLSPSARLYYPALAGKLAKALDIAYTTDATVRA